ncbi:MAG TPA: hypothetical protein HPP81_05140 [Deltaproteobacteria bacterium]|nr:hypothetical protein [Deltaproteobacteria bacterium]
MEDSVKCRHCGSEMRVVTVKKYPGNWPWLLIGLGVVFSLFIVGATVGLPMLLLGAYMATATMTVNQCTRCGYYFKVLPE